MNSWKDTNPKDAVGIAKVPVSTVSMQVIALVEHYLGRIPLRPLFEVGLGMMEGALKYGRHNYRVAGVRASVYFDAAWRHRAARKSGQLIDPDSGLPHIVKEIAGLTVLCDSMLQGNWVDDRPPRATKNANAGDLSSWWEGQDTVFSISGEHLVVVKVIGDLLEEREAELKDLVVDEDWQQPLNIKAKALLAKYPEEVRKDAFTEVGEQAKLAAEAQVAKAP